MSKNQEMQNFIRYYKQETGEQEVDMHKVAEMAINKGWKLPKPVSPAELLAKQFSLAAREEVRYDKETGHPYRVNHVFTQMQGTEQLHLWVDIDEAGRQPMLKSLVKRRELMVADGYQLTLDADHWNRIHPTDEPIQLPMDLTLDIDIRKAGPSETDAA